MRPLGLLPVRHPHPRFPAPRFLPHSPGEKLSMPAVSNSPNVPLIGRRTLLRAGAIGTVGLSLPQLLQAEAATGAGRGMSCIFIFAWGGPHHLDTFDPKPDATAEIRGMYGSIATSVPEMRLVDQFPRLAKLADTFSLVRSLSHDVGAHNAAAYLALTGRMPAEADLKVGLLPPTRRDFPSLGSVLAKLQPTDQQVPSYVMQPITMHNLKVQTPGQMAGFLGGASDPFVAEGDPNDPQYRVRSLVLQQGISRARFDDRRALLDGLNQPFGRTGGLPELQDLDSYYDGAYRLLSSSAAQQAFNIQSEPVQVRERYGRHRLGQSLLLARRLVESGVRIVMVNDADERGDAFRWDTHNPDGVPKALKRNLPETDVALSALLEDLRQRGLLETTLVVWMGEMGRTPKERTGHWTKCYPALVAGGGIQGGRVYGRSDRNGAYPVESPCSPADIHATVYHAMGLRGDSVIYDDLARPIPLYEGQPIKELF